MSINLLEFIHQISMISMFCAFFISLVLRESNPESRKVCALYISPATAMLASDIISSSTSNTYIINPASALMVALAVLIALKPDALDTTPAPYIAIMGLATGIVSILLAIYAPSIAASSYNSLYFIIPASLAAIIFVIFRAKNNGNHIRIFLLSIASSAIASYISDGRIDSVFTEILLFAGSSKLAYDAYRSQNNAIESMASHYFSLIDDFDAEVEKEVKHKTFYIENAKNKMAETIRLDHLTGAFNRKALIESMNDMILSSTVKKFVMILFDIDNFKEINDTLGHTTGDICLRTLVSVAKNSVRDIDIIGRYGGDEFVIMLPNSTIKEGLRAAERFRQNVEKTTNPPFTVSIGVSAFPWDGSSFKELMTVADKGLYLSKASGRNCVRYSGYLKPDSL